MEESSIVANIVVIAILAVVIGLAVWQIIKRKKRGEKCVGCPYCSDCCSGDKHSHSKKEH